MSPVLKMLIVNKTISADILNLKSTRKDLENHLIQGCCTPFHKMSLLALEIGKKALFHAIFDKINVKIHSRKMKVTIL